MAKINILDSSIYNLIAAGEVVERPASVIKELIENSIDAGAKNITVEIKDGGTTFMQVSDDGSGIDESDLKSAFLPHATSKIKEASDLDSIFTLGFRGEALASIASVAKVKLVSKTENAEMGSSLTVEGGKFGEIQKVSSNVGTIITVKDLFFCVPARAKFLKKNKTEEQEITNIINRVVLAHPEIKISYIVDGKKVLSSIGSSEKEAMFSVYGKESVRETLEVFAEREGVSVKGFVGKPTYSKSNRTYQTLIINGRYVINLTVQTAVANAYGDFLMKRQYPFFVLYLTIPVDEIDVNVHPNKLDVKFLKSNLVYSVVFEAVSRALNDMDYVKQIDTETNTGFAFARAVGQKTTNEKIDKAGVNLNPFSFDSNSITKEEKEKISDSVVNVMLDENEGVVRDNFGLGSKLLERINDSVSVEENVKFETDSFLKSKVDLKEENKIFDNVKTEEIKDEIANSESFKPVEAKQNSFEGFAFEKPKTIQSDFAENEIKIIGKIFNTYLMIEWGENVYLIDQHAGHERIRYDKLKEEYETGSIVVQPMLIPFVLSLNPEDDQILYENLDAIKSVGFDIEEFGDRTYKISAVPTIVSDIDFNKFFSMFLAEKIGKSKITEADIVKDKLMQLACKSAIKGGDDLSKSEVNKLLQEMGSKNIVLFCPHGRPVVVRITKAEVEKWFKRIV
ncbi:MAG: DNA mismatch repair endonuclease MutL [Clostridia bacterium]|nr:DNA mismatch repair endonuclease MutL [Clostridia bacterium]